MNKKVLTLCAGVLLVSGSAVFTMNALNVGNENAPVVAYAAELRATTGYTLGPVTSGETNVWTLTKEGYLSPVEDWYVGENNVIVKGTEKAVKFTIDEKTSVLMQGNKAWTIDGKTSLYLWNAEKKQVTEAGENLTLATAKQDILDLSSDNQVAQVSFTKVTATTVDQAEEFAVDGLQEFSIKKVDNNLYLAVELGSDTKTYYAKASRANSEIEFVETPDENSKFTIEGSNGAVKIGSFYLTISKSQIKAVSNSSGSNLVRAFNNKQAWIASTVSKATTPVYLATFGTGVPSKGVKSERDAITKVEANLSTVNAATYSVESVNEYNTWTVEPAEGKNYLKIGDKYLTLSSTTANVSLGTTATSEVAVNDEGQLTLGGQPLYISEDGFTVLKSNAEPAAIYAVTEGEVDAQPSTTIKAEAQYVIAQALTGAVMDVKYATDAVTVDDANAPGAEYGDITNVVIDNDGILHISADVTDAQIPVYIYYLVNEGASDEYKVYLAVVDNKLEWTKDAKTAWALHDGKLYNLDAAQEGKVWYLDNAMFTTDGIIASNLAIPTQPVVIALSQTSLVAKEIDSCELPLLMSVKDAGDNYVMLGGYIPGTSTRFAINQPLGQEASFVDLSYTPEPECALWRVKKHLSNYGRYTYSFTNRVTGEELNIDGCKRFMAYNYNGGVQLLGVDGNSRTEGTVVVSGGVNGLHINTSGVAATVIGFYQSPMEQYTAHYLLHRYGSSFRLNVVEEYKNITNKTIWGNEAFEDADLVPVVWNGSEFHEIAPNSDSWGRDNEQVFLLKKKGTDLYAVLDVDDIWSNANNDFVDGGYKFKLLSETNLKTVLTSSNGEVNGHEYYPYFRINYLEGTTEYDANGVAGILDAVEDNTPVYCVEIGDKNQTFKYDLVNLETTDANNHLDVFVTVNERCADKHNEGRRPAVSFYTDNENIVRGEDAQNNPLNYRYVNISFKAGANMQFRNENSNWVNLNGKVLGINQSGWVMPTEADYFLFDKAEGQWAVSMTDAANDTRKFTFTNRENPSKSIKIKSMHALGNDVYAVEYDYNSADESWMKPFGYYNGRNQAQRDTLVIKAAKGNLKLTKGVDAHNMDSYANWTKEDLQDKTFQLSIDAAAQLYVTENEGKDSHFLGLTDDALEVTNWRLVPFTATRVHDTDAVQYLTAGTDSVYTISHPMGYVNNKFVTYNDTTAIVTYALQNIQNNEWLTYDPSQNQTIESMICDPYSKNFTTANLGEAYRFVLKEKAEGAQKIESGAYNIIGVNSWVRENNGKGKYVEGVPHYTLNLDNKLYGATSYQNLGAIEVENAYVQPTSNDIFTIATTASQEYVKATPMDTVRIYGAEENDYLLYENGQFLNMGNKAGIAPAMVLDTAYYNRPGNNRYQYLIVLNPNYVPAVPCEIEGHPALHPDTMYGRFLVNQIDSAVMVSRNHNNKFINDIEADEKELKLGFQWGYRTGDKLYLTAGKDGKVIEIINLGTPDFNKAKFAFKYVNEAVDKQFKVQTAWYDYDSAVKAGLDNKDAWTWNNEGYLRSVNGVIVVTNGYTHGEEFLMAQENSDPTANESINASSVIVAGVDGAVVVKGAEGKNVIVSTILGKVVANETVSSDNATIAAPAGIVVVSVDGESFKVVVK